jgi:hypothetical protein
MKRPLVLVAALVLGACAQDLASIDERIAGTYQLLNIDGDPIPIVFRDDSVRSELVSSELLMGLNGVYRQIDNFRTTRGTTVTTQVDTFTAVWNFTSNNTLSLTTQTQNGPLVFTGAWDGNATLIFTIGGLDWVYRR